MDGGHLLLAGIVLGLLAAMTMLKRSDNIIVTPGASTEDRGFGCGGLIILLIAGMVVIVILSGNAAVNAGM